MSAARATLARLALARLMAVAGARVALATPAAVAGARASLATLALATLATLATLAAVAVAACAAPAASAAQSTWSGSEQPLPPGSSWPVGLGKIGDIEFVAPDRGLLITEGEPPAIPAGVWAYNGREWHELASVCGASYGRIAWAGPSEFWTVSNGRAGQANEIAGNGTEVAVPLEDNTLCHFAGGQLVGSYAHPADEPDSYQAMHAAACLSPADCWFAGDPLPEPQTGAFHLHWNGSALENAPYLGEGHAVEDMIALENHLYESVRIARSDRVVGPSSAPAVHRINPEGIAPAIVPEEGLFEEGLPLYGADEPPTALEALQLSAAGGALWGAAGRSSQPVQPGQGAGQVTVVRAVKRTWSQLIGPEHPLEPILPDASEEKALLGLSGAETAADAAVSAIAAEPGTGDAWVALAPRTGASASQRAVLLHISSEGAVLEEQTLPAAGEGDGSIGPKGAAARLACPAAGDCWLATTEGWLFHLAPEGQRTLPKDPGESEYFTGLITYRPPDQGLPQVIADAPPPDDSGLPEGPPPYGELLAAQPSSPTAEARVTVPLLSHLRTSLVHGSTLELRFHLAVKARVRLVAKRHRKVVAATAMLTLQAGNRSLRLALQRSRWPTKLGLQSHALAKLPTRPAGAGGGGGGAGPNTVSTGLAVLPGTPLLTGSESLR